MSNLLSYFETNVILEKLSVRSFEVFVNITNLTFLALLLTHFEDHWKIFQMHKNRLLSARN